MEEMDAKQQAFLQFLVDTFEVQTQEELDSKLKALDEDQMGALIEQFEDLWQSQNPDEEEDDYEITEAKFGVKLCPKGTTLVYHKIGGRICKACAGKKLSTKTKFHKLGKKSKGGTLKNILALSFK